jgi:hypothetical protein
MAKYKYLLLEAGKKTLRTNIKHLAMKFLRGKWGFRHVGNGTKTVKSKSYNNQYRMPDPTKSIIKIRSREFFNDK